MNITIVTSTGYATTLLSAFDKALFRAGVSNYNLIRLSSIIPPGTKINRVKKFTTPLEDFGKRLYVVMAEMRSNQVGKYIAAGIGWYQLDDGRGFFVEHEMMGETKIAVESELAFRITSSLRDMCKFRHVRFQPSVVRSVRAITKVANHPTCVLALAIFKAEPWE